MNRDERETITELIQALEARWDAQGLDAEAKTAHRLLWAVNRMKDYLEAPTEDEGTEARPLETLYWLELHYPETELSEKWQTPGCGYEAETLASGLDMLSWQGDHRRRLVRVDTKSTVVAERAAETSEETS